MSLSVSGSNSSLVTQLMKSMRDTAGNTGAADSTAGPASTAATSDSSGAPSSAMMAFLAQLSGSTTLGSDTDGDGDKDTTEGAAPVGHAHGGHHHGGGAPEISADAASVAGTTLSSTSTSQDTDPSSLVAAFAEAMQNLTAAAGTNGGTSLATDALPPPPPGPGSSQDASGTTGAAGPDAAGEAQFRAFRQAMQAYAAQSGGGSEG